MLSFFANTNLGLKGYSSLGIVCCTSRGLVNLISLNVMSKGAVFSILYRSCVFEQEIMVTGFLFRTALDKKFHVPNITR